MNHLENQCRVIVACGEKPCIAKRCTLPAKTLRRHASGMYFLPDFLSTDAVDKDVNSLSKARVSQLRIRLFYIVMKK